MKGLLAILGAAVAGGALVVSAAMPKERGWSAAHTERMRGYNAYYAVDERELVIAPQTVRLSDSDEVFLVLGFVASYRLGKELVEAEPLVQENLKRLTDRMFLELAGWKSEEIMEREGKLRLKRVLRELVQTSMFPKEQARVERIYLTQVLLQRTK